MTHIIYNISRILIDIPCTRVYGDDNHYHENNIKADERREMACAGITLCLFVSHKLRWPY